MTTELFPQGAIESLTVCIHLRFLWISMPVSAAVCGHDPVKVFGELTAIIGEGFFDPHAEHVLHGGE